MFQQTDGMIRLKNLQLRTFSDSKPEDIASTYWQIHDAEVAMDTPDSALQQSDIHQAQCAPLTLKAGQPCIF